MIEDPFGLGPDLDKKVQETAFALDVAGMNVSYRTLAGLVLRTRTAFGMSAVDYTAGTRPLTIDGFPVMEDSSPQVPMRGQLVITHSDAWLTKRRLTPEELFELQLSGHSRKVQHNMRRRRDRMERKLRHWLSRQAPIGLMYTGQINGNERRTVADASISTAMMLNAFRQMRVQANLTPLD